MCICMSGTVVRTHVLVIMCLCRGRSHCRYTYVPACVVVKTRVSVPKEVIFCVNTENR